MQDSIFEIGAELVRGFTAEYILARGKRTEINQVETRGLWEEAQAERVQSFLKENEWEKPAYDVYLPRTALQSPWLARNGASIKWVERGWTGVIRRIDPEDESVVIALVVLTTRT